LESVAQQAVGRSGSGDRAAPAAAPADPVASAADHRLGLLADLPRGQRARLVALTLDPGLVQRLGALGLQPGRVVQVLRRAPWAGPIHLQVGMTELMLRRSDARRIQVQLEPWPAAGSPAADPPPPGAAPGRPA